VGKWTDRSILDEWWASRPWKAVTTKMDFREGANWFCYMLGPDGIKSYCRADFKKIIPNKMYVGDDAFCDEKGNINNEFPVMHWKVEFSKTGDGTKVEVELTFDSKADMDKIIELGFKEGFASAHTNLDELLAGNLKFIQMDVYNSKEENSSAKTVKLWYNFRRFFKTIMLYEKVPLE
jgi:uncharacterized protein YndB with AHSA1/START domain